MTLPAPDPAYPVERGPLSFALGTPGTMDRAVRGANKCGVLHCVTLTCGSHKERG